MVIGNSNSYRDFQLVAGYPALDFTNTLDWRFRESGPDELLKSYGDLVRFAEQSRLLASRQAQQLLRTVDERTGARVLKSSTELRETVADVFYTTLDGRSPSAASLKILERFFQAAHLHQALRWKESHLEWDWSGMEGEAELPLWLLSWSAASLMTSAEVHRVRACDNSECRWLFLDTSKNHTRRWCDMKICGNRMKARRFKAQREM